MQMWPSLYSTICNLELFELTQLKNHQASAFLVK